ncbi:MAG: LytR C-terminal domain-containing protein [Acidimicrobiales bacterium]
MTTARRARTGHGHRRRTRPAWWAWSLPFTMVILAAGVPFLLWYAADAIVTSTDGTVTQRITDPAAPGYEVAVVASPSYLVLGLDPDGELDHVALMSVAANDEGGTVLLLPAETLVEPTVRLLDVHRADGDDGVRRSVSDLLQIGLDAMSVLDEESWRTLLEPVGPVPVDITEDLVRVDPDGSGATEVLWRAGSISVAPEEVSTFLGWVNRGEDRFNRLRRQKEFWTAWLAAVAVSDDPGVVPGEIDEGIGRFVRGAARDPVVITPSATAVELRRGPAFELDVEALRDTAVAMIPFPLPPEDSERPRVRLLDGAGGLDVAANHGSALVRAGAQIVIIGNATQFGANSTVVVYHDGRFADDAAALGDAVGANDVYLEDLEEPVVDITVIIGEDQRA